MATSGRAQWTIQQSGTRASLRGINRVGDGIAWASGAGGTVLRTTDDGQTWKRCVTPPGAESLDFRGIQGVDQNTAFAMSSGPGDRSKVYKTIDGCRTWRLVFTNPDTPNGFFDAIQFLPGPGREKGRVGDIVGDPVDGVFPIFRTSDYGETWTRYDRRSMPRAKPGESLFAASNSGLIEVRNTLLFVTGGSTSRSLTLAEDLKDDSSILGKDIEADIPVRRGESAGAFSVAVRLGARAIARGVHSGDLLVVVGGDYRQPEERTGTCAVSVDGSLHWTPCEKPPGGYRSAVAYDGSLHSWITVGPNGTDISTDDGVHWQPLKPDKQEPLDADRNWNALSLPFVVGPNGRIGRLSLKAVSGR